MRLCWSGGCEAVGSLVVFRASAVRCSSCGGSCWSADARPYRGRCSVPTPAVMNSAVAVISTSAVCHVPGSLITYWPASSEAIAVVPSVCS